KIDLRKDIRVRIGAPEQIAIFLQDERRIELCGSSNHELRSRSHGVQQRTRSHRRERLSRAAVRTKHIVSGNTSTAKAAIDCLYLNRLLAQRRRRHFVADPALHQLFEMISEHVSQLACGAKTILG